MILAQNITMGLQWVQQEHVSEPVPVNHSQAEAHAHNATYTHILEYTKQGRQHGSIHLYYSTLDTDFQTFDVSCYING